MIAVIAVELLQMAPAIATVIRPPRSPWTTRGDERRITRIRRQHGHHCRLFAPLDARGA
jgi:hypothetical protein